MSHAADSPALRSTPQAPLARAVVPILVAAGAVTLALALVQAPPSGASGAVPGAALAAAPDEGTPYSEMHRRVQDAPGEAEPLPPTF